MGACADLTALEVRAGSGGLAVDDGGLVVGDGRLVRVGHVGAPRREVVVFVEASLGGGIDSGLSGSDGGGQDGKSESLFHIL